MCPPLLTLSDARITNLETQVATLLGRVAVLEAALSRKFPPAFPVIYDPLSSDLGADPQAEVYAAATFLSVELRNLAPLTHSPAAEDPALMSELPLKAGESLEAPRRNIRVKGPRREDCFDEPLHEDPPERDRREDRLKGA